MWCYAGAMGTVSINLRLPAELHAQLKEAAEEDRRSLNSEIIALLEWALENGTGEHE